MHRFVPLLPDLRSIVRSFTCNLDLYVFQETGELQTRFINELSRLFNGNEKTTEEFIEALSGSKAIISGSFLVHFMLDQDACKESRDIDIFVTSGHKIGEWLVEQSAVYNCKTPREYRQFSHELDLTTTYYLDHFDHRFQITTCRTTPHKIVETFDFRCCQLYFDGDYIHLASRGCWQDLKNRSLTTQKSLDLNCSVHQDLQPSDLKPLTNPFIFRVRKYMLKKGFACSPQLKGWILNSVGRWW